MSRRVIISKEKLEDLYINKKLTTYQIAEKIGCCQATIWKKLIKFKIERRKPHELYSNVPSKERLLDLYINKKLSTWKIEKQYGYSRGTVHRKLKEIGIIRDRATAHIVHPRKDFSGNLNEKAYLIGFRIGDLGVRKIFPNSKTITVASGSTIPEQIKLIKGLFKGYGKIWVRESNNGKTNVQISLNESFSFLLDKEIPLWLLKKKDYFFAFLAGFTDAEGWIGISNGMAIYSLGTCDYRILETIKENLEKFGVKARTIVTDKRKGKPTTGGYFFSSNYHTLGISKKADLLKLFIKIKPYVKHKNKIKALKEAEANILWRNKKYGKR